jgi:hydroxyacylglutathione hydrolase
MSTLEIKPLTLGELQTNCYLAWESSSREAIVIDPADEGGFISEQILEQQLNVTGIVLTHGHFDHVLGLLELSLNFPVPIYMHQEDQFLLENAASSALHWLKREVDPVPQATHFISENDMVMFGDISLSVLHTPGHTPGSISLVHEQVVFSGDTLFKGSVGRTDFTYASPLQLNDSLHKLFTLPDDLTVLPGHGEPTTIGAEKLRF